LPRDVDLAALKHYLNSRYVTGNQHGGARTHHGRVVDSSQVFRIGALLIGPSLGHFYTGRHSRALVGVGIRTLAGAGVAFAAAETLGKGTDYKLQWLGVAGAILGGASLAWDIIGAPQSADVRNDQLRRGRATSGVAPTIGLHGFGLSVQVSF
jgi:hypothetical protein